MSSKQESYFGLSLQDSMSYPSSESSLSQYGSEQLRSPREQAIFEELTIQDAVINAQAIKTGFGLAKIHELHQHSMRLFDETLSTIWEVKEQSRGKEHQAIINEFTHRQINMLASQTHDVLRIGAVQIAVEIHRPLYVPPPPPPEKKGFIQRLFGGE